MAMIESSKLDELLFSKNHLLSSVAFTPCDEHQVPIKDHSLLLEGHRPCCYCMLVRVCQSRWHPFIRSRAASAHWRQRKLSSNHPLSLPRIDISGLKAPSSEVEFVVSRMRNSMYLNVKKTFSFLKLQSTRKMQRKL